MKELNIGLFGLGTVGSGIFTVLQRARNCHARISRICVRSLSKPRAVEVPENILTDNPADILSARRAPLCSTTPRPAGRYL